MPRRGYRALIAVLASIVIALGWSNVAFAHTDFDSSDPADQATVDGPLASVAVNFTNPASPSGEGFELLDPSGEIRVPTAIDETDGTTFVLHFDPPLTAGTYGVRWKVQAGDAHPIDGTFQFEVIEPVPASTTPTATTVPAAAAVSPPTTAAPVAVADEPADEALGKFFAAGAATDDGASLGGFGRTITTLGTIFGVGALAALMWVIRGRRDELRHLIAWIRLAGIVIAAGGLIELAALQSSQSAAVGEILVTKPGLAATFKLIGGMAVWFGFHDRAGQIVAPARSLSAAVAADLQPVGLTSAGEIAIDRDNEHRWTATTTAALGLAGYTLVLASYWFDGHTVSKGPWLFHSLVNFVHLGAAAVWGGGVLAMTTVAWLRRRRSERVGMAAMVVRFSTLATISLAALIAAGLAMTVMILDSPGDLFGTEWGRLLVVKTMVVAIAAGLGGYNHFRLRPALEASPDDPGLLRELRISLTIESVVFGLVVILTAWLVAAAT